jgi:error-prone DNA polymerase
MDETEAARADLWSTGMSVRHPVEFVREWLADEGCLPIERLIVERRHGHRFRVGGIITHRQRPMTAKGVIFFNLEDETGILNVVVLPAVWDANREAARRSVGVVIDGVLEHRDGVTNLVAQRVTGWPVEGIESRNWGQGGR